MTGKCVLITGAASGVGRAVAHRLARSGATLALVDRNSEGLERVAAEVAELGGRAYLESVDVTDGAAIAQAVARLWEATGGIDVSLQSAGILRLGLFENGGDQDLRACMEVNLFGTAYTIAAMLPLMRKRGRGHLINMVSVAGLRGLPYLPAYSASKFAVYGLSQALRDELVGTGIAVSVVCPSSIRTPMVLDQPVLPPIYHRFPWLTPEEVADVVVQTMERPRFLVTVDLRSRALLLLNRLFPRLVDRMVLNWSH
jgi:NAD(P)-dependent dehydrogenase (short-subunit alcohol dehydrogenase family)